MYFDENNLYGWGMSQYLLYCEFKWLKNIDKFDVNLISENSSIGYILEVDLECPDELHYLHNDYPLAPEKLAISYDTLSNYCKRITDKYGIKVMLKNLKQSDWLKKYIDFNTEKRKNAANSFEKDFFKLMINSVHGKTMENLRKRINVRLVNNEKYYLKHVHKPTFISQKIFDKSFAAIHEIKPVLTLNKPVYVGFTVLELSKWLIYDFQYNFIKKNMILTYILLIQKVLFMKSNRKMIIKIFLNTNTCLTLVKFNQVFLIQLTKELLAK